MPRQLDLHKLTKPSTLVPQKLADTQTFLSPKVQMKSKYFNEMIIEKMKQPHAKPNATFYASSMGKEKTFLMDQHSSNYSSVCESKFVRQHKYEVFKSLDSPQCSDRFNKETLIMNDSSFLSNNSSRIKPHPQPAYIKYPVQMMPLEPRQFLFKNHTNMTTKDQKRYKNFN